MEEEAFFFLPGKYKSLLCEVVRGMSPTNVWNGTDVWVYSIIAVLKKLSFELAIPFNTDEISISPEEILLQCARKEAISCTEIYISYTSGAHESSDHWLFFKTVKIISHLCIFKIYSVYYILLCCNTVSSG